MNKVNFKQPKYIFPIIIVPVVMCLAYFIGQTFQGKKERKTVVTDSINMSLPDASNEAMGDKMSEMNKRFSEDGAYTAIGALGEEREQKDSTTSGYRESELDDIDAVNAKRDRERKEVEALEATLAQQRKHFNRHQGGSVAYTGDRYGNTVSRQKELDDYARELENIQRRSMAGQRAISKALDERDGTGNNAENASSGASAKRSRNKTSREKDTPVEVVKKVRDTNQEKFNTVGESAQAEEPLIRAMIDKTTKAHEGTRLRFKLLDDITIRNVRLRKGTYLYGLVTGFGQQRVMASITSILVDRKFIRVSLSVYDNDGMQGFYVPESAFRDMMRDAGSQAMQQNLQMDGGYSNEISGEAIALQALQNMYQSASSAVSANMRKNKARIKYNTIVYLINTDAN